MVAVVSKRIGGNSALAMSLSLLVATPNHALSTTPGTSNATNTASTRNTKDTACSKGRQRRVELGVRAGPMHLACKRAAACAH
jgi:hypothetical protein